MRYNVACIVIAQHICLYLFTFYVSGWDWIDRQAWYSCQWKQRRSGLQTFVQCNVSNENAIN